MVRHNFSLRHDGCEYRIGSTNSSLHWDTRRLAGETLVVEMTSARGIVAFDEVTES